MLLKYNNNAVLTMDCQEHAGSENVFGVQMLCVKYKELLTLGFYWQTRLSTTTSNAPVIMSYRY